MIFKMDVEDNKEKSIISTVTTLAVIGVIIVILAVVFLLLTNRRPFQQNGETRVEEEGSDKYGIHFEILPQEYALTDNASNSSILDCRKFSIQYRVEQESSGSECYKVEVKKGGENYIEILTGNGEISAPVEKYISLEDVRIYPDAKINLPTERIEISGFPTNLNGIKIVYPDREYVFYKGIVYKGADQYSIAVHGEINAIIMDLFNTITLD